MKEYRLSESNYLYSCYCLYPGLLLCSYVWSENRPHQQKGLLLLLLLLLLCGYRTCAAARPPKPRILRGTLLVLDLAGCAKRPCERTDHTSPILALQSIFF